MLRPRSAIVSCFRLRTSLQSGLIAPMQLLTRNYSEAAAVPAGSTPEQPAKKEKKKKEKKAKAQKEASQAEVVPEGEKLHVKRKLCRQLPVKKLWTVVGPGRLLEFEFHNNDILDRPTYVTNYPEGDDDPEQDEVDDAFSGKGEKTGTQSKKKTDDDDL